MLKRSLLPVFLAVAVPLVLAGCATTSSPKTPPMQKTALWKVTSAHRTLYITGALGASLKKYPVPAPLSHTFAQSGELVLEGDPKPDAKKLMPMVMKLGLQPPGKKLSDDLSQSQLKLVKKAASMLGIPFARMQRLRPWFATVNLRAGELSKLGIKPHQLYLHFYNKAENEHIPVSFLNKAKAELKRYGSIPQKAQVAWLRKTAKDVLDPKRREKRTRRMQDWRNGGTKALAKKMKKMAKEHPQLYKILITSYQPRWLKTFAAKLDERGKPVFVLVNAGNLVGPDNILQGLRKAGYHVTQL